MEQVLDANLFDLVNQLWTRKKGRVLTVFALLGQLWTRKKALLRALWTTTEQALSLAFTPRTEKQRSDLAIRAGELLELRQAEYETRDVKAGLVLVSVKQTMSRVQDEQLKWAFRRISGTWKLFLKTRKSLQCVANRTRMLVEQKLEIAKSDAFGRLKCSKEVSTWENVEEIALSFYSRISPVCFRIRNQRMRLGFSSIQRKTQKLDQLLIFRRIFIRQTQENKLFSFKKILLKVAFKKKIYESASGQFSDKLKSLLVKRLKCVKTCLSFYIGVMRCAAVLNKKVYERRVYVIHVLISLLRREPSSRTLNFLYITQALRTLPATKPAFKRLISTEAITPETFNKQGLGKAVKLIFEYGLRVICSGKDICRREQMMSCWSALKTLPRTRASASVLGRKLYQLTQSLQPSLKRSAFSFFRKRRDEFARFQAAKLRLFAHLLRKTYHKRKRFLRVVTLLNWKNAVAAGNKANKSRKMRSLALRMLSQTGKRALRSHVNTVLGSDLLPLVKERCAVFQRIILGKGIRSHMRNALFSIETRVAKLLKVKQNASWVVRIVKKEAVLRTMHAMHILKCHTSSESSKRQRNSEKRTQQTLQLAMLASRLICAMQTQGMFAMRHNLLSSFSRVACCQTLTRIQRFKQLKLFKLKAKMTMMLHAFERNQRTIERRAFLHWTSKEDITKGLSKRCTWFIRNLAQCQLGVKVGAWRKMRISCFWKQDIFRCSQAFDEARARCLSDGLLHAFKKMKERSISLTELERKLLTLVPYVQKCAESSALRRWTTYVSRFNQFQELVTCKFSSIRKACCRVNFGLKLHSMRSILRVSEARRRSLSKLAVLLTSHQKSNLAQSFRILATNKLIYPEQTLTKLMSAKRLGAVFLSLHKRVLLCEARNLLSTSRVRMSLQRQGLKLCLRSWNGVIKRVLGGCFHNMYTSTGKDSYRIRLQTAKDVTLMEISQEKERMYRLLSIVRKLGVKGEQALKEKMWKHLKWGSAGSEQSTEQYQRKLFLLRRTLLTIHIVIERPSLRAALTQWISRSAKRSSTVNISSLAILTAFRRIKRAVSYRLSFQAFEAIRAISRGKEQQIGIILVFNVLRKSHVKRTAKALR